MGKVIEVRGITKKYDLGTFGTGSLKTDIQKWWAKATNKDDPTLQIGQRNRYQDSEKEYWALKGVSFDVQQGEVLGVIGKNGAGKSTLLKILSRITLPTSGNIGVKGRIASLLEVGTGFHPELSGRDNIFLNGAILGMTKSEIRAKFEEIVEFSGVSKFIDTPVKRYSSGMYVRLAFAVAAHLEPEILIIDEVLAVGDSEFQKKCLGKMRDVSVQGRTVIYVSHNMASVKQLCTKGIVLQSGATVFTGSSVDAVNFYQNSGNTDSSFRFSGSLTEAPGNENIRIQRFDVKPIKGEVISLSSGIDFEIEFYNFRSKINLDVTFELKTLDEIVVFHDGALVTTANDSKEGVYTVKGQLGPFVLNAGTFVFNLIFGENQRYVLFKVDDFIQFEVLNETKGSNAENFPGVVHLQIPYSFNYVG
ncbi:MAG TPA: ABC transporter ATP-binding protein [Cytophagaceae bacterium]